MLHACRLLFQFNSPSVSGARVRNIRGNVNTLINPSFDGGEIDRKALATKLSQSGLGKGNIAMREPLSVPLPRRWVKAPVSVLSSARTREDWFRVMSFNMMADSFTFQSPTTPVHPVMAKIPGFLREGNTVDDDAVVDYDAGKDEHLLPFLEPEFRRQYLVNEIRYYDPDIVCLTEVNRVFFNEHLFRYVRYWGYGALYQSSRGAGIKALRKGDDPTLGRHAGKISEQEDIGNVILFHKGRFVPILMPGADLGKHFHFGHIVSLRDKVTNMTVVAACTQFTPGDTQEAALVRQHESQQLLTVLDSIHRNDSDRAHMTTLVCGDFNNVSDEEACISGMRDRLFSAYDIAGGPRWTTWFHEDENGKKRVEAYFQANYQSMLKHTYKDKSEKDIRRFIRKDAIKKDHGTPSKYKLLPTENGKNIFAWNTKDVLVGSKENVKAGGSKDPLALVKCTMENQGIVYRTQDFVFYDPNTLALHQVLDIPEEEHIEKNQLLPCKANPSHHISLIIDVSFNNTSPDVAFISQKN